MPDLFYFLVRLPLTARFFHLNLFSLLCTLHLFFTSYLYVDVYQYHTKDPCTCICTAVTHSRQLVINTCTVMHKKDEGVKEISYCACRQNQQECENSALNDDERPLFRQCDCSLQKNSRNLDIRMNIHGVVGIIKNISTSFFVIVFIIFGKKVKLY